MNVFLSERRLLMQIHNLITAHITSVFSSLWLMFGLDALKSHWRWCSLWARVQILHVSMATLSDYLHSPALWRWLERVSSSCPLASLILSFVPISITLRLIHDVRKKIDLLTWSHYSQSLRVRGNVLNAACEICELKSCFTESNMMQSWIPPEIFWILNQRISTRWPRTSESGG